MILENIVVGPLGVNCYLIGCEQTNEAAIIDPGDETNRIIAEINKKKLSLTHILLTHAHVDHLACLMQLKEAIPAEVLMHADDIPLLEGSKVHAAMFGLPYPGTPKADRFLVDGDKFKIGNIDVEVLHTPGHSPGSLTYKIENNLFVGDLIFAGSIGRTDLPGGSFDTLIQAVQSKIFILDDHTKIFPGHGPATTVGEEKRSNPFF